MDGEYSLKKVLEKETNYHFEKVFLYKLLFLSHWFESRTLIRASDTDSHEESILLNNIQKQPSRVVLRTRCSQNMQQIYGRTSTPVWFQ